MPKALYIIFLFIQTFLYAQTYIIKLASYKDISGLEKQISHLSQELQSSVKIINTDNYYKLVSKNQFSKDKAIEILSSYKSVFPDAYIMKTPYLEDSNTTININLALSNETNNSVNTYHITPLTNAVMQPDKVIHAPQSFQNIIQNKTFYLCPEKITSKSEKLLIKAIFEDNNVTYTSLIGSTPKLQMQYLIKANRLYTINHNKLSPSQYSTVTKILFDYMVIARWFKGKVIHKMRYYYKEKDARSYLDSIHLD